MKQIINGKPISFFSIIKRKIYRNLSNSKWLSNKLRVFFLKKTGAKVGKDVYLATCWQLFCKYGEEELLTVGNRASIGASIALSSNPNNSHVTKYFKNIDKVGEVKIGDDAWLAMHSMILPGVTIGKYSIVGAGSLVIEDVPPYTIVVGSPAKIIKQLDVDNENTI